MDHSEVKHLPKVDHTPAEMDAPSRLLLKGADLIDTRGHCQFQYTDGGGFCFMGAMDLVGKEDEPAKMAAVNRFVTAHGNYVHWNDAPGRTKDEVVSAMCALALGL